jgi:hypothetical protein
MRSNASWSGGAGTTVRCGPTHLADFSENTPLRQSLTPGRGVRRGHIGLNYTYPVTGPVSAERGDAIGLWAPQLHGVQNISTNVLRAVKAKMMLHAQERQTEY